MKKTIIFLITVLLLASYSVSAQNLKITSGTTVKVQDGTYITSMGAIVNDGTIAIAANGTVKALGSFDATNGAVTFTGAGNLKLYGTVTSLGALTTTAGTVSYNKTGDQTIFPDNYYNLTVLGTGLKSLNTANTVEVSGNLTTTGGTFTINSDATTSGSLIVTGTSTGNIIYNRYMTGVNKWHLIAAPVGGQSINTFATTGANNVATSGVKYSITPYNNTFAKTDPLCWNHWTSDGTGAGNVSGAGNFTAGKGYEVLTTANGTVAFTGTVPVAQVSIPITVPSSANAWNLIGNPFPSSLFANSSADASNNFITVNSAAMDASYLAIYLWNPGTATYNLINQASATTYIAPGQGFFVKSVAGGATVNFTTAMRTNQVAGNFQKAATTTIPDIILSINNGTTTKTTEIKYIAGTTLGLDPGYDAGRFGGNSSNFDVYTHLVVDNGVDFMLQVLPDNVYDTAVIPIGITAKAGTQITFKANASNLPIDKKMFLEDHLLGVFNELNTTDKTYTATINKDINGIGRFFLHTLNNLSTLGNNDFTKPNISVIVQPNNNNIRIIGNIKAPGKLDIYDITGRLIKRLNLSTALDQNISVSNMAKGVYYVTVKSLKGSFTTKIAWY